MTTCAKSIFLAAALALAVSCSPEIYTHYLDVRKPSDSGLDLSRKSIALVYMEGESPADSAFNRSLASSLARSLEEDYFGGEEVIGLYKVPRADSLSLEEMRSLVMDTGEDVVFLLRSSFGEAVLEANQEITNARSVDSAYVCASQLPLTTTLSIYDSMGEDAVIRYTGSIVLRPFVYNSGITPEESLKDLAHSAATKDTEKLGERIARRFISNWQTESFSFYYYDDYDSEEWITAIVEALEGNTSAAIDRWARFLQSSDERKKACACYNLALVFYMADDMSLATRWLEIADSLYPDLTLSRGLHTRIENSYK